MLSVRLRYSALPDAEDDDAEGVGATLLAWVGALPDEEAAAAELGALLKAAEWGARSHTRLNLAEGGSLSTGVAALKLGGLLLGDGASVGDLVRVRVDGFDVGLNVAGEVADLNEVGVDNDELAVETL